MSRKASSLVLPALLALGLYACTQSPDQSDPETDKAQESPGLAIATARAEAATDMPLGSVPGVITLPPDARHAVTSAFPGAAIRIYVIEGQPVRRGAPLALVRATQPVSISGDIARARAELGVAESQAARLTELADEGIVARARADEANARLAQARATLAEAQRLAALSGTGPDGTITLRAPISGRVAHVGIDTGEMVGEGSAPFIIEAEGPLLVELQLPQRLARQVRPGMGVQVQVPGAEAGAPPFTGQIRTVAPSIETQTRSVRATASIAPAPGLVAGQNVMVTISGATAGDGVWVPASAVTRMNGQDHVFVADGDSFAPRAVEVVANAAGRAVIAQGLAAGEVVATSAIAELKAALAE